MDLAIKPSWLWYNTFSIYKSIGSQNIS